MLNYIWAALLISAFVFAGVSDIGDLSRDTYRNGQPLPVVLEFPEGTAATGGRTPVRIRINAGVYQDFYGTDESPLASYDGVLLRTGEGMVLRFDAGAALPEPLETIRGVSRSNDDELQGTVEGFLTPVLGLGDDPTAAQATVQFEPVRFVKMTAIGAAALDFAETAAGIAIGLIGVLALFLGVMKIAEEAGIIYAIVRVVRPVLRPLFPDVPDDHPALGMIALNLTANVFGLGNAGHLGRAEGCTHRRREGGVHQCARHGHGGKRQDRMCRGVQSLRPSCGRGHDFVDQVDARPPDRRHGRRGTPCMPHGAQ